MKLSRPRLAALAAFCSVLLASAIVFAQPGIRLLTSLTGNEVIPFSTGTVSNGATVATVQNFAGRYTVNETAGTPKTVPNGTQFFMLDTNTPATVVVNLPTAPSDGSKVVVSCDIAIGTSLTIAPSGSHTIKAGPAAGACAIGTSYGFLFRASNTTWYRVQ